MQSGAGNESHLSPKINCSVIRAVVVPQTFRFLKEFLRTPLKKCTQAAETVSASSVGAVTGCPDVLLGQEELFPQKLGILLEDRTHLSALSRDGPQ